MELDYLDFDHNDNGDGSASWDAMANLLPARLSAALLEVERVLGWAHAEFGNAGEWCDWDYDLQCQQDGAEDLSATFDCESQALRCTLPAMDGERCTLTLTLRGTPSFGEALQKRFSIG